MDRIPDAEIAEILALDEKRTPGEWKSISGHELTGEHPSQWHDAPKYYHDKDLKVLVMCDDCEDHPIADTSCNHTCRLDTEQEDNAAFIAAAPRMAAIIRQQQKDIESMKAALEEPSEEMVERVADAIWLVQSPEKDVVMNARDGKNPAPIPTPYIRLARAAIKAMGEATRTPLLSPRSADTETGQAE